MNTQHAIAPTQFGLFAEIPTLPRRAPRSAALRKANGQFLAKKRAGNLWQENTLVALAAFLKGLKSRSAAPVFTFEEFRVYCEASGHAQPRHLNAWGVIPAIAVGRGMVAWTGGYTQAVRAESHGRIIKTWMAA